MSMRQLWEGSDAAPWAQKADGRTKLILLFCFALLTVTIDTPRTLFYLFTASLLLHLAVRTSLYKWQAMIIFLLIGLWGSMFSQALFFAQNPRTPLWVLLEPGNGFLGRLTDGIVVYREGILYGAIQGLRSATMLSLGLLICWTSDPRQLLKALVGWRLSAQMAFVLVTAIRFLPVLAAEAGEILIALRLRTGTGNGRSSIVRYLPYVAKPLLARCLRRAQTLALSVVSRGVFLAAAKREATPWLLPERIFSWALITVVCLVLLSKILSLLAEEGLYYGQLRIIYDWTKLHL